METNSCSSFIGHFVWCRCAVVLPSDETKYLSFSRSAFFRDLSKTRGRPPMTSLRHCPRTTGEFFKYSQIDGIGSLS